MNFTSQIRYNPKTGRDERYYRLKESYRNALGHSCTRILLHVGFVDDLQPEEMRDISRALTYKYEHQDETELWPDPLCVYSDRVRERALEYWDEMLRQGSLDIIGKAYEASKAKAERHVDTETLKLIKEKGYDYLCVSRKALTDYEVSPDARTVTVRDCRERPIKLQEVHTDGEDYYLKIDSPAKSLKEESMNRKFRKGFEDGMQAIAASLTKKGGTKKCDAVLKRIGKLEGKYPSIARYYQIDVADDGKGKVTEVKWQLHLPEKQVFGTYFLRTSVKKLDEKTTWDYYNLIREIECTNRQTKTDLNLRPIYHRKDDRSDAHRYPPRDTR